MTNNIYITKRRPNTKPQVGVTTNDDSKKQFSHRLIMNNNRNQLDGEGLGHWLFSLRPGFLTM